MHDFNLTIDGRAYRTAARFDVINPATGKPAGTAPNATAADLDAAVAAAKAAFATWSQTSDADRQAACGAVAAVLGDHAEELAALITAEQGKPLNGLGSRREMGGAQAWAGVALPLNLRHGAFSGLSCP